VSEPDVRDCAHAMLVRYERLYDLDVETGEWSRSTPPFMASGSCISCGVEMCLAAHPHSAGVCWLAAGHEGAHRTGGDGGTWIAPMVPRETQA
jgi:hypothetical protein